MLFFFCIPQGGLPKARGSSTRILLVEQHLLDEYSALGQLFCIFNTLSSPTL